MAVAYDVLGLGNSQASSSISWNHTASTSTNSVVIAMVSWTGTLYSSCSVTYGGTLMAPLAKLPFNNTGTSSQVLMFSMSSPPTGVQSVVVTVTAASTTLLQGNSMTFTGVTGLGNAVMSSGTTGTTMSATTASFKGMMAVVLADGGTSLPSLTNGTQATASGSSGNETVLGYATDIGDSFTFTATMSSNSPWAGIAVPIKGTSSGSGSYTEVNTTGTFSVPAKIQGCYVTLIGGGGGGASGATRNGSTRPSGYGGGGGGGGAGIKRVYIPASALSSTYTVGIGAGGIATTTQGQDGNDGTASTFTSGSTTITAGGGVHGIQGLTPTGGAGGVPSGHNSFSYEAAETGAIGGTGSTTAANLTTTSSSNSLFAGAGGGGGGSNLSVGYNGGAGGTSTADTTGGAAGIATGGNGGNSVDAFPGNGGAGGGGAAGGASTTTGGTGGNGGSYGAGGGGGGGKEGSFNGSGGPSGAGAVGYTKVEWIVGDNNFMRLYSR